MPKSKQITAEWQHLKGDYGGKTLVVLQSNHERFKKGSRFDFGFLRIANSQGFTVTIKP